MAMAPAAAPAPAVDSQLVHGTCAAGPRIVWSVAECQGKRPYMEDRALVIEDLGTTWGPELGGVTYLSVMDGHGGTRCVDFTKEELHERLSAALISQIRASQIEAVRPIRGNATASAEHEVHHPAAAKAQRGVADDEQPCGMSRGIGEAIAEMAIIATNAALPTTTTAAREATAVGSEEGMAAAIVQAKSLGNEPLNSVSNAAVERAFVSAFASTDDAFMEIAAQENRTDGTTVLSALFRGATLDVANVGDTRAVLGRKPLEHPRFGVAAGRARRERDLEAVRLSLDHKPELSAEMERIKKAGGFVKNSQGCYRVTGPKNTNTMLAVSRAFGDRELKLCTPQPLVLHTPTVVSHDLTPRDRLLILASDGLWDVVDDAAAVKIATEAAKHATAAASRVATLRDAAPFESSPARAAAASSPSAAAAAERLIRHATERGSLDNITVLVAWLLWDEADADAGTPTSSQQSASTVC